jgi:hypothetical protein
MHPGYGNAVAAVLSDADIGYDKVPRAAARRGRHLRSASARILPRRQSCIWPGQGVVVAAVLEETESSLKQCGVMQALFAVNRRLFKAYVLREQLDQLWQYATPMGVGAFLLKRLKTLRRQRLPELERLGRLLVDHVGGDRRLLRPSRAVRRGWIIEHDHQQSRHAPRAGHEGRRPAPGS